MTHKYPHEKTVFNYLAAVLIYGHNSPMSREFCHFVFPTFNAEGLEVYEVSSLKDGSTLETSRHVNLDENRTIQSSHIERASGIARSVTYVDTLNGISISDALFSDEEFASFAHDWNKQVESKIQYLGILIVSLYRRNVPDMLLSVNDYPNISKIVFEYPEKLENHNETR